MYIAHLQSLLVAAPGHHHGQAEQACGEASFVQTLADHLLFVCYVISKKYSNELVFTLLNVFAMKLVVYIFFW